MDRFPGLLGPEGLICGAILLPLILGGLGLSLVFWVFKRYLLPKSVKATREIVDTAKEAWEEGSKD